MSKVLVTATSAEAPAVPPLPVLSVLLDGSGSGSLALTVVLLSNGPVALMVAVTLITSDAPSTKDEMVQGKPEQLVLLTADQS